MALRFAGIAIALSALSAPNLAVAQERPASMEEAREIFDRGCGDDNAVDRCADAEHKRMRDLYGVETVSDMADAGAIVRRAMYVDGYGRDIAVISFVHAPGSPARVEVHIPTREGAGETAPLGGIVSPTLWNRLDAASINFDRELVPPDGSDDTRPLCLHSWFVVAETADPARIRANVIAGTGSNAMARDPRLPVEVPTSEPAIRTASQSACGNGLAVRYAFELAEIASEALPECSTLDPDQFRNIVMLLAHCRAMGGDRLTAGEASGMSREFGQALYRGDEDELRRLFVGITSPRSRLFSEDLDGGQLLIGAPTSTRLDRVELPGAILFYDEDGKMTHRAPITLNLLRQSSGFLIDTWEIGEREAIAQAE